MSYKKLKICCLLFLIVAGFVYYKSIIVNVKEKSNQNTEFKENSKIIDSDRVKLNNVELLNKVFTFGSNSSNLTKCYYLYEDFLYYIHIELVTPHNVTNMDIWISDPDGKEFHVFESKMFYEPEYCRCFDIPYGTIISGNYTFKFNSISDQNYNLYIKIEQCNKCLYDKIESPESIISKYGNRFYYNKSINYIKNLESDRKYIIYIGRVSSIAITENIEVKLDCIIYDPNNVPFIMCDNEQLEPINSTNKFSFSAVISGEYSINIRIYCNVDYVNVACAICEDYKIQNTNNTEVQNPSSLSTSKETDEKVENSIPLEWLIGITAFIGVLLGVSYIGLFKIKRRNILNIKII